MVYVFINQPFEGCSGCADYRAKASTSKKAFTQYTGTTYLSIKVNLDRAPSTDVTVNFEVTYDYLTDDTTPYEVSPLTFDPPQLSYLTWNKTMSFKLTIDKPLWDATKTSGFKVHFYFTGTDAAAFKEDSTNDLQWTVIPDDPPVPDP